MIPNLIESLLPGARNLRPPLIGGLLWAITAWIAFADLIPASLEDEGFARQVHDIAGRAGSLVTASVGAVLIFVIGAAASSLATPLSRGVGAVLQKARDGLDWRRHAYQRRVALRKSRDEYLARVADLEQAAGRSASTTANKSQKDADLPKRLQSARENLKSLETKLAVVEPRRFRSWYLYVHIPKTSSTVGALGSQKYKSSSDTADRLIELLYEQAISDYAQDKTTATVQEVIDHAERRSHSRPSRDKWDEVELLRDELLPDPLDALRAHDEKLYLEFERERVERDVRLAISLPIIVLSVVLALSETVWALLGIVPGGLLFAQSALLSNDETARVLRILDARNIVTPAMRTTIRRAQQDTISYISESTAQNGAAAHP